MIASITIFLSLVFLALLCVGRGEGLLIVVCAIDLVIFLLGIVAVVLAYKRRYPWRVAIAVIVTPLLHLVGTGLGPMAALVIFIPSFWLLFESVRHQFFGSKKMIGGKE